VITPKEESEYTKLIKELYWEDFLSVIADQYDLPFDLSNPDDRTKVAVCFAGFVLGRRF